MKLSKKRAAARGTLAARTAATENTTVACHNLRHGSLTPGADVLQPVGSPAIVAAGDWKPQAVMHPVPGFICLIVTDGCRVGYIDISASGGDLSETPVGDVVQIAVTDSPVSCALPCASSLYLMTGDGPRRLRYFDDTREWVRVNPAEWTPVSLIADEGADCTATVAPRRLSRDYTSPADSLDDRDLRAVTSDLRRAYAAAVRQAAASGDFCAPALMRLRFIGHDGAELCSSPPLLLGAADSGRLTDPISVTSDDRRTLGSYDIAVRSWRPHVRSNRPVSKDMSLSVSRIELLACPQFHPFDPSGEAGADLVSPVADNTMLRLTMPGAGRSVSAGNAAVGESRLRRMLEVMPRVERVVAVIRGPFAEGRFIDCSPELTSPYGSVADECRAVERSLALVADRPAAGSPELSLVSQPHSFAADSVAASSGRVLWGGLAALRFDGYPASAFAGGLDAAGAWHSAVTVTFASGDEQVVAVDQGTAGAPRAFNPLLGYPSADAVAMTVTVSAGGMVRRQTVPLTPLSGIDMSVYVDPSFAPFALSDLAPTFVIPAARPVRKPLPGFVASAGDGSPLRPRDVAPVAPGAGAMAVFPASRSLSSWDFGRARFSALTSQGIFSVTLAPDMKLSVSLIDSRSVADPRAAVDAGGRLLAAASGSLVEVGASRVRTLLTGFDAAVLAYCAARDELWASADGSSQIIALSDMQRFTRDEVLGSSSIGTYAVVGGSLCCLDRETPGQSLYVRWDCAMSLSDNFVRPVAVALDLRSASVAYGSVVLKRMSHADEAPAPVMRLTVDGAVRSPLRVAVAALPMRRAAISFQGRVSPDTMISSAELTYLTD